jgi:tRNA (mo5U34)-methyltransferase
VSVEEIQQEVVRYPWYHTLELGDGVVTNGMFDHRGHEESYGLTDDLTGKRCLDVGTMDGFWAFAMERRGASSVVAVDVEDPEDLDWPASQRSRTNKALDESKGRRFEIARAVLSSSVERRICSVYRLSPHDLGEFDFVFCGDLLVHLKDPAGALEKIRSVCKGTALIVNPVKEHFPYRRRPLAQFDGIREFEWWLPNSAALTRMVRAAGFSAVITGPSFELPATGGGKWRGKRRWVRATV